MNRGRCSWERRSFFRRIPVAARRADNGANMRVLLALFTCAAATAAAEPDWAGGADHNGRMAGEALSRNRRVMHAWLKLADPVDRPAATDGEQPELGH